MLQLSIAALKDPHWVAKVQGWLGVSYAPTDSDEPPDPLLSSQIANFIGDTDDTEDTRPPPKRYYRSPSRERMQELSTDSDISQRGEQFTARRPVRTNPLLHLYFSLATELGYEPFYITFMPFLYWNCDPYIGFRITLNWMLSMYIGQALKNYWRIPRPACPPAIPLEFETATEYGAPSTHAIVATGLPFYLLHFGTTHYQIPFLPGLLLALLWTVSVCLSRVYLGVHSLWDIFTGVIISIFILFLVEPLLIRCDPLFLSFPLSASLAVLLTEVLLLKMYPRVEWWSPDLGDTGAIIGSSGGILIGSCFNPTFRAFLTRYCSGQSVIHFLFTRITTHSVGICLLRFAVGVLILIPIRFLSKFLFFRILPVLLGNTLPLREISRLPHYELPYKLTTYNLIGIMTTVGVPIAFHQLGIPPVSI